MPPYAPQTDALDTCPPIPPSAPWCMTYPMPLLPTWKTHPPGTSTGFVEPRSRSLALSWAQVEGANRLIICSVGESSMTESLPS